MPFSTRWWAGIKVEDALVANLRVQCHLAFSINVTRSSSRPTYHPNGWHSEHPTSSLFIDESHIF